MIKFYLIWSLWGLAFCIDFIQHGFCFSIGPLHGLICLSPSEELHGHD